MTLPVAILAGGLATRLRPITTNIPKSLVKVAGQPFIFHQLEWLRSEGVRRAVLCLGFLGELIRGEVGDGHRFGLDVDYSFDGGQLLGTGGALKKAVPHLGEAFFVLYGDSYLRCSLANVETAFRTCGKPALMTVLKNLGQWDQSNVLFREGHLVRYDKRSPSPEMRHIDYGLSVVRSSIFEAYDDDVPIDLAEIFMTLSKQGALAGFEVRERFYEIGSQTGLKETEAFLAEKARR